MDDKGDEVAVGWWRNRVGIMANDAARQSVTEKGMLLLNSQKEEERGIVQSNSI